VHGRWRQQLFSRWRADETQGELASVSWNTLHLNLESGKKSGASQKMRFESMPLPASKVPEIEKYQVSIRES
jgi:hypothetical protein